MELAHNKHFLGNLCPQGHDHEGTGKSLRYNSNKACVICQTQKTKEWRHKNPEKHKIQYNRTNKNRREKLNQNPELKLAQYIRQKKRLVEMFQKWEEAA